MLRTATRVLKPLAILGVLAGTVFLYTAGYLDPALNSPAVKAFTGTAMDAYRPYLLRLSEKVPALQKWISPFPKLEDLSDAQNENLRQAAMASPEAGGLKVAMELSSDFARGPIFYVAGNVPEGTRLGVRVVGIPDTLLNQTSFTGSTDLSVGKRLGKSSPLHSADGKPIPKGQYAAYLVESADDLAAGKAALVGVPAVHLEPNVTPPPPEVLPKDAKILAIGSYFLGGPKDASYDARLKEYHAKLAGRAADELRELHQFSDTLQAQLDGSIRKFTEIRNSARGGKLSPAKRKEWETFDQSWLMLSGNLNQTFSKWTSPMLEQEYFYGVLYQLTQQAGQAIDLLHKTQETYWLPTADHKNLDDQLAQSASLASTTLSNLRAKMDQAGKIPPSPNGMPRRDGL